MDTSVDTIASKYGRSAFDTRFNRQLKSVSKHSLIQEPHKKNEVIKTSFAMLVLKICSFMAVVAVIFYFAAEFYGDYVSKAGHTTDQSKREIYIASDVISIPANMIRYRSQRSRGNATRLDLYAHWPSLSGYSTQLMDDFDSLEDDAPIIFLTLEKRSMSAEMSGRVEKIYEKFFAAPPIDAGNGLVRRPFSADSAYFSEDLFYELNSPYPYAARCIRQSDEVAAPMCMRDIHIGRSLTLTYRFHSKYLPQWAVIEQAIRNRIGEMIAG